MSREALVNANLPAPVGYSRAVRAPATGTIYTSMTAPVGSDGSVVGVGDAPRQAEVALANISDILDQNGATLEDVVKITVYLTQQDHITSVMTVVSNAFSDPPPAIAVAVIGGLPNPDFLLEIEAIAQVG